MSVKDEGTFEGIMGKQLLSRGLLMGTSVVRGLGRQQLRPRLEGKITSHRAWRGEAMGTPPKRYSTLAALF